MKVSISAQSDVGLERTNNEDAYIFCQNINEQKWGIRNNKYIPVGDLGCIAVVADGMGGNNAGEIASNIALESIKKCFNNENLKIVLSSNNIYTFLEDTIKKANNAIMEHVRSAPETIGMGTTIVLLWIIKDKAHIAWCGDSRCYVFNPQNGLKSLSKDHSYVQDLIDRGEITIEESYSHPDSSIITRCLGDSDTSSIPDIITYDIKEHDMFLLCSDGLCGYCKDAEIENVLYKNHFRTKKCTNSLIKTALNTGGFDNITVLLLSIKNIDMINYSLKNRIKHFYQTILLKNKH